jgi:hypothetical protein
MPFEQRQRSTVDGEPHASTLYVQEIKVGK